MVPGQDLVDGYVCYPYNHTHDSIELKDMWTKSKNIESMYFVTATFSRDGKAYFVHNSNHYLLARFKNNQSLSDDVSKHKQPVESFVFNMNHDFFEREVDGNTNFISVYYLDYGESTDDLSEIAHVVAKRENIARAGVGRMDLYCTEQPKFTFPYSKNVMVIEVSSEKSHQSVNKYCEKTRSDVNRKGYAMTHLLSLSILEKLK